MDSKQTIITEGEEAMPGLEARAQGHCKTKAIKRDAFTASINFYQHLISVIATLNY